MKTPAQTACFWVFLTVASVLHAADTESRWYLKFDAGVALTQDTKIDTGPLYFGPLPEGTHTVTFDPGVRLGLAGGYRFAKSWAVELETGFVYNALDTPGLDFQGSLYQVPIFANVVYQVPLRSKFKPYVGAGLGAVIGILDYSAATDTESMGTLGFQAFAGVMYELKPNMDLGLGYRFMTAGTQNYDVGFSLSMDPTYTHAVTAQFTFKF